MKKVCSFYFCRKKKKNTNKRNDSKKSGIKQLQFGIGDDRIRN